MASTSALHGGQRSFYRPRMIHRSALPFALVCSLAGCGQSSPASGSATTAPTQTAATNTATANTATTAATAAPTQAATATAAAMTAPAPPSAEPTVEEWEAAKIDLGLITGADAPGCLGRRIREWIRFGCSSSKSSNGQAVSIQVVKGFQASKISILKERNGALMLIFPAQPGLDAEAAVNFADASFRLKASWPAGQPEPKAIGSLERVSSPAALTGSASVSTSDPLPPEPTLEGAPTLKDWSAAKEVGVKGSSAVGCETRMSGDWFRMVCRSNPATGKATSGVAIPAFDAKKGYVVSGSGATVVVTQFVKGSEVAVDLGWEKTFGRMTIQWPKDMGRTPALLGDIVTKI